MPIFQKLNSGLQAHKASSHRISLIQMIHPYFDCVSTQNKEDHLRCHFTALHTFTQKLIHAECPTLLTGTSKNAVIRGPVWSTVREHPAYCLLSLRPSLWVSVWWRQMGERWVELHRGLCCVVYGHWSLSRLDIVKWGHRRGRPAGSPGMRPSYQL